MSTAPLSSRLFMLAHELPAYLATAYEVRFKADTHEKDITIFTLFQCYIVLVYELITSYPTKDIFEQTIKKLDVDFAQFNETIKDSDKPICAYFVSSDDDNGAILGDPLYYYHHHKIKNLQPHYAVAAKVVRSTVELFDFLKQLKTAYPGRQVQLVDIVSHGTNYNLAINHPESRFGYTTNHVKPNEFKDLADDAVVILDACSTGEGSDSIAEVLAQKNPGKTIIAPQTTMWFSKPVITKQEQQGHDQQVRVNHVVHGFALIEAYTCQNFHYPIIRLTKQKAAHNSL